MGSAYVPIICAREGHVNDGYGGPVLRTNARAGFLFAPRPPQPDDRATNR
jgi:hypothetical protein